MFLSAIEPYVVGIIIGIVAVQYGIALFCLLKLAYLDISKREYVLWNLFILLVFFIGDAVFLIYLHKVGKDKKIPPYVPAADDAADPEVRTDGAENTEKSEDAKNVDNAEADTAGDPEADAESDSKDNNGDAE